MTKKLLSIGVMLIVLLGVSLAVAPQPALAACGKSVWLTPRERPGPIWEQERHWLEAPFAINGRYAIVNMREHRSYDWKQWDNKDGRGRFGVSTRWALVNFWWKSDPWLLLYNC